MDWDFLCVGYAVDSGFIFSVVLFLYVGGVVRTRKREREREKEG